jgi:FkbM family methyltransferase
MILLLRILHRLSILPKVNVQVKYPVDSSIKLPLIQGTGYEHLFESERWLFQLLKRLLPFTKENTFFIDVGVNIGQTMLKVMAINRATPYLGFEPNPHCLHYINAIIRLNNFSTITIYPFAVSDKSGVIDLEMYSDSATDSLASIVPNFRKNKLSVIRVPAIKGEDIEILSEVKIGILKIDVEGGELNVIKGLLSVLERDRPLIICEVLPVYTNENQLRLSRQTELETLLKSINYSILLIESTGSFIEIESIGIHNDIDRVNYMFYPSEGHHELMEKVGGK